MKLTIKLSYFLSFIVAVWISYVTVLRYLVRETHTNATHSHRYIRNSLTNPHLTPNAVKAPVNLTKKIRTPLTLNFTYAGESQSIVVREPNLIIGIATNTDPKYLAIFAGSLRLRAQSNATVLLFVNTPICPITQRLAQKYLLTLLAVNLQAIQPSFLQSYHPSSLRWILIHRLFADNHHQFSAAFEKVLALDIRDAYFQSSPFPFFQAGEQSLFVFAESRGALISGCSWNSGWIRDCLGEEAFLQVAEQPIICSGVSLGRYSVMAHYVYVMHQILLGYQLQNLTTLDSQSKFPKCERNGIDQGIHNYLIHSPQFKLLQVTVQYSDLFPVINLQAEMEVTHLDWKYSESTQTPQLVMSDGREYAVIHQYDRNPDLSLSLCQHYIDWLDWSHPLSEWQTLSSCQTFQALESVDLFRGMCDVGSVRAITPASCCSLCQQRGSRFDAVTGNHNSKDCSGFTFVNGVCYLKDCSNEQITQRLEGFHQQLQRGEKSDMLELKAVTGYYREKKKN